MKELDAEYIYYLVNVITTLGVFTFVYGDNPIYRFLERQILAIAMAWIFGAGLKPVLNAIQIKLLGQGQIHILVALILGALLYTQFIEEYSWLSRYPVAVIAGTTVGLASRAAINAQILAQLANTFVPLTSIDNIITVVGVVVVLIYFIFSRIEGTRFDSLTPTRRYIETIARFYMMLTFGSYFGNRIMGDVARIVQRFAYVLFGA